MTSVLEEKSIKRKVDDKTEAHANWSKDLSTARAYPGAMEHLPSGRIDYDPFRYVKEW